MSVPPLVVRSAVRARSVWEVPRLGLGSVLFPVLALGTGLLQLELPLVWLPLVLGLVLGALKYFKHIERISLTFIFYSRGSYCLCLGLNWIRGVAYGFRFQAKETYVEKLNCLFQHNVMQLFKDESV